MFSGEGAAEFLLRNYSCAIKGKHPRSVLHSIALWAGVLGEFWKAVGGEDRFSKNSVQAAGAIFPSRPDDLNRESSRLVFAWLSYYRYRAEQARVLRHELLHLVSIEYADRVNDVEFYRIPDLGTFRGEVHFEDAIDVDVSREKRGALVIAGEQAVWSGAG